ncbi:hypothetical protein [Clostridium perfringens]|uniref:hypothetical protein n=1 Tax=Clostridium perfringens TaxID=1502 RepID=UPI00096AC8A9|nr:hypothetical protein [Clostridium perfringens]
MEIIREKWVDFKNLKEGFVYNSRFGYFIRKENIIYQLYKNKIGTQTYGSINRNILKKTDFELCTLGLEEIYDSLSGMGKDFYFSSGTKHLLRIHYKDKLYGNYYKEIRLIKCLDLDEYETEEKITKSVLLNAIIKGEVDIDIHKTYKGFTIKGYYDDRDNLREDIKRAIISFLRGKEKNIDFLVEKISQKHKTFESILTLEEDNYGFLEISIKPTYK